jgi:hypothetical protein
VVLTSTTGTTTGVLLEDAHQPDAWAVRTLLVDGRRFRSEGRLTLAPEPPASEPVTQDEASAEMTRVVQDLHARHHLVLDVARDPDGDLRWTAAMSGEDFLDGPWTAERTGTAPTVREALQDGVAAFYTRQPAGRRSALAAWWRRATRRA